MPRQPRNPGSGKRPHNGSARGSGGDKPAGGHGWGGSAKGAHDHRQAPAGDEYSDHVRALARDPKHAEAKAPLRELAMTVWVEVCKDVAHPQRVVAAEKLMDRLDGKPKQQTDITSGGDRLGYVIAAPTEAADAEEWASQHKPH